ncbi:MAG: 4-hydroxy-tetrahydrodipicolinate reductase [Paludibacteraceae bacterium]|nr:4-hydroxy-tetrahydrodipicolinate reductase [Paludibacteraceae bacterium]
MKIAIIGYGKMGHMVEQIAIARGHQIVCRIDQDSEGFDSEAFASADVAIEFSTPASAKGNILRAWEHNVPVVCGTTGWDVEELRGKREELRTKTGHEWLIWKSNFSIGVNVFFELNKQLATLLSAYTQYTPSITEVHHIHKLDKPSGTAKTLAEGIMGEVPIESIREGEVAGIHTVVWDSPEDTITIQHSAKGRQGFALGAVMAAEEMINANENVNAN